VVGIFLLSNFNTQKKVEKTFVITDEDNIIWKIEKYTNDLKFINGSLRFDYNLVSEADISKFPRVQIVQLKSSTPITTDMNIMNDILSVIETNINCGGGGYIGKYWQTNECTFIKGKYYQAYIVFPTKEMKSKEVNPTIEQIKNLNIKGKIFISSPILYNDSESFDDYLINKNNLELSNNSQLPANYVKESKYKGYSQPNKLLQYEYSTF
jgi:hypothetical protein